MPTLSTAKKEILMVQAMNSSLVLIVAAIFMFDIRLAARLSALIGVVWLATLLIAPRLLKIERLKAGHEQLLQIARNSKWIGIWTGLWFLWHSILSVIAYDLGPTIGDLLLNLLSPPHLLGTISTIIFIILLALSNNWSYKNVKLWKHINMLVWLIGPFALGHAFLATRQSSSEFPYVATITLLGASIIVGVLAIFDKKADYFKRYRLLLLMLGTAIAMALTLWFY